MRIYRRIVDLAAIERSTGQQRNYVDQFVERTEMMTKDPERKERLAKQECVVCYKSSRIGGAAMTTTLCGICAKEMHFGSTNADWLCHECAKAAGLCRHCGADIELKHRRKRTLPAIVPTPPDTEESE